NPVQINGKAVSRATVKAKGQFQVGITVFSLEMGEALKGLKDSPPFKFNKKTVLLAGLLIVCLFFLIVLLTGKEDKPVRPVSGPRPSASEPDQVQKMDFPDAASSLPGTSGVKVSVEDREKSEEHFRQGMFFYDTGNSLRAVGEWKRALSINPDHSEARIWFLKAEKELEEKAKTHYQNAMLHYKYMRYKQALDEFRMVVELSRDKNSDQYINSMRYMNEIQGR
ncbi:MAG: tetratricopeptide repeat protein, partial [Deltaproteobacteria bacterium]|nr:tetratricopeptide repeat protein [Deltaproteobacteria bacterium]